MTVAVSLLSGGSWVKNTWRLILRSFAAFSEAKAPRLAAALSYHALFSIAPVLIVMVGLAGVFLGEEEARTRMLGGIESRLGPEIATTIDMIVDLTLQASNSVVTIIGAALVIFGATRLFTELQGALKVVFRVPEPPGPGWRHQLGVRLRALGITLALTLVVLAAIASRAGLDALHTFVAARIDGMEIPGRVAGHVLDIIVLGVTFAVIFRLLSGRRLDRRALYLGSLVTSVLYYAGDQLIGWYLRTSAAASAFGAAATLVTLLLFVYYSMQIVLFGASFTREYERLVQDEPGDGG